MTGFLLKKSFLLYWDNLYKLLCVNLCLTLLMAICIYLSSLQGGDYPSIVVIYFFNLLIGATSLVARKISDYDQAEISLFLLAAKTLWKDALFFTACLVLHVAVLNHLIPFYLRLGSKLAGLSLAMLLFWICAIWWVAMIYYYPLRLRLNLPVFKAAHNSLLLLTDNLSLSLAIFLLSSIFLVLSLVTSMLLPGISFVLVFHQVAGRTVLLKYDYLESHPLANKKDIPWSLLLKDDLEIIGKRSLKQIIFPWKE
jgi:hypothetical protein